MASKAVPAEALSGLSHPATVTLGAMLFLSAGLQKTGAVAVLGRWLVRRGRNRTLLLLGLMPGVGVSSAFINNTATVTVFLPMVPSAAAARKVSASKLLIPLSHASQFGGVCTLIGTSTNPVVHGISQQAGLGGFELFEFAALGGVMFAAGTVYLWVVSPWLLPDRRGAELTQNDQLGPYITEVPVTADSPLLGRTVLEARLGEEHDGTVLELIRGERKVWAPLREPLREGDICWCAGG